jgi:hypothetical protein
VEDVPVMDASLRDGTAAVLILRKAAESTGETGQAARTTMIDYPTLPR